MELSKYANIELGEAFFKIINKMLVNDGVPKPKAEPYQIISASWYKLSQKPDKTEDDISKLENDYKTQICELADSCVLFIGAKTGNRTYMFTFDEYKKFLELTYTDKTIIPHDKVELKKYDEKISNQFNKIANHGEMSGDNLIDNKDFAAFIYALDMKASRDENNKFKRFNLTGSIEPHDYGVMYSELKSSEDNMASMKLRLAYKFLFQ